MNDTELALGANGAQGPCIYLDHHATTPMLPSVCAAMSAAERECGNSASAHSAGQRAKAIIEQSRAHVAAVADAAPGDVILLSGATEADNLAIRGTLDAAPPNRRRLVVSAIEHSAVLATARHLAAMGRCTLTVVPVRSTGLIDAAAFQAALGPDVALACVMAANNEVGTIQPIAALGRLCDAAGVPLLVDAAQAFGKIPVLLARSAFVSVSAHKIGGPQGVGALLVRGRAAGRGVRLYPQMTGGTHEAGWRAGTQNLAGILGFGVACYEARRRWPTQEGQSLGPDVAAMMQRRNWLAVQLLGAGGVIDGVMDAPQLAAPGTPVESLQRLPQNLNIRFPGVCPWRLHELLARTLCVSAAAACKSLGGQRSHVLTAMGLPDDGAVIRFGLGLATTNADVQRAAEVTLAGVRGLAGTYLSRP